MKYEDIKDFNERCETHPDHQSGMISYGMIEQRLQEEIDELREYIEKRQPLTEREVELIDGMIEVQLHHAMQCDRIANRTMADKQKGWDMERVELLQKLKAAHGIKGESDV